MSRASDAGIAVRDLSKGYGEGPVLDGLSFDLPSGETLSVIGPSGCGKSTLLYLLAGLDKPDRGTVSTGEVSRRDKGRISFILQDYGLFPWKTVQENLSLPSCKRKRLPLKRSVKLSSLVSCAAQIQIRRTWRGRKRCCVKQV